MERSRGSRSSPQPAYRVCRQSRATELHLPTSASARRILSVMSAFATEPFWSPGYIRRLCYIVSASHHQTAGAAADARGLGERDHLTASAFSCSLSDQVSILFGTTTYVCITYSTSSTCPPDNQRFLSLIPGTGDMEAYGAGGCLEAGLRLPPDPQH